MISFSEEDLDGVTSPYDDDLVIKALIAIFEVSPILVDTESSTGILYRPTYLKMGLASDLLTLIDAPLVGFDGDQVSPKETINLPVCR